MPGFIAKKLCPDLIIVPLNFDKYRAVSKEVRTRAKHMNNTIFNFLLFWKLVLMSLNVSCQIRDIFADYDPHFMPMSLDEAFLDFTDHLEQRQNWPESSRTHHYRSSSTATGRAEHFIKSFRAIYNVLRGLTVAESVYAFCVVIIVNNFSLSKSIWQSSEI